jgi:hypothetical protein
MTDACGGPLSVASDDAALGVYGQALRKCLFDMGWREYFGAVLVWTVVVNKVCVCRWSRRASKGIDHPEVGCRHVDQGEAPSQQAQFALL